MITEGGCSAGTGCCGDLDIGIETLVKVDNYKFSIKYYLSFGMSAVTGDGCGKKTIASFNFKH